jgi:hypothetical protein
MYLRSGARHTLNPAVHLPVTRGGTPVHLRAPCGRTLQSGSWRYCSRTVAEQYQLRRRTAIVRLLYDAVYLTVRHRHSEIFNDKL